MNRIITFDTKKLLKKATDLIRDWKKSFPNTERTLTREDINPMGTHQRKAWEIPRELLGNISDLKPLNQEMYERLMRNCSHVDKTGKLIQLGILKSDHINAILSNSANQRTHNLNILNQRLAKHLLGRSNFDERLQVFPFDYIDDFLSSYESSLEKSPLLKSFVNGDTTHAILKQIKLLERSRENAKKDSKLDVKFCTGLDWSPEQIFERFLELTALNDPYCDFKAAQLIHRGYMLDNIRVVDCIILKNDELKEYV